MTRLRIVTDSERSEFDSPPLLSSADRKRYFNIPNSLQDVLRNLRSDKNRARFLLKLGYFRAVGRFFTGKPHEADLEYVVSKLGFLPGIFDFNTSEDRATSGRHRKLILKHLGFRDFGPVVERELIAEIRTMVRSQMRPKFILLRIVDLLRARKIEIPTARTLTDLIAQQIRHHRHELIEVVDRELSDEQRELLDALLEKHAEDKSNNRELERYKLTLLKRLSQSTRPSKIKENVEDLCTLRHVFEHLDSVVEKLDLSQEGMRYYAYSVIKSQVFQISRRSEEDRYLHLVCFVANQFYRAQDTLIDALLICVQSCINASTREYKEVYYERRTERRNAVHKLATAVKQEAIDPLDAIEDIMFCRHLSDAQKVQDVQKLLTEGKSKRKAVAQYVINLGEKANAPEDTGYYQVLESKSLKLQNRVSEIVKEVEFEGDESSALIKAINYYKQKDGSLGRSAPIEFLEADKQTLVFTSAGKLRVSLYKSLLFIKVADAIKAGALNVRHSYKYRSLDDYLIEKQAWMIERETYLQRAGLDVLSNCRSSLARLEELVEKKFRVTNNSIEAGDNPHLFFRKDGSFHVSTPKVDKDETEPLANYFPQGRCITTLEVLSTVNKLSGFLDEFRHWQIRHNRTKPPDKTFYAGIIGYGSFIGTRKMARISKMINESELENTVNWYFSLENIHAANDRLLKLMSELDLPDIYRKNAGILHTSSDGQKYEVAVDSLNANYSFKYLGKDKGVATHNFTDERHFNFHCDVISSSEKEAAYVIDGVMHNDVIKSDIHSTDTAGYSEAIFASMHLLGFTYAPRIKGLKRQQLYSFASQRRNDLADLGYRVLPNGYINTGLIEEHWDDILRFIATIKLKETTASQLFRRLNSYSKQHPLWKALKEFGKIVKTIFILEYIDDVELRQAIEKQLNKGESSNKFSRAISLGRKEFLHGEKVEQEIAEGCRRLIKNSIICWNYLVLSQQVLGESDEKQRTVLIEAIRNGSVVTWQHINLQGEYDFSDETLRDSIGLAVPKKLVFDAA